MRARRPVGDALISSLVSAHAVVPNKDPGEVMLIHVAQDGARAAGWLVRSHRARFRRTGEVDFVILDEQETPAWMRIALEKLKLRRQWKVLTFKRGGANDGARERVYRVTWLGFGKGGRTDG